MSVGNINFNHIFETIENKSEKTESKSHWLTREIKHLESGINELATKVNAIKLKNGDSFGSLDTLGEKQLKEVTEILSKTHRELSESSHQDLTKIVQLKLNEMQHVISNMPLSEKEKTQLAPFIERLHATLNILNPRGLSTEP